MISDPDFPNVVLAFPYRGCRIEIDQGKTNGQITYAAWIDYPQGFAMAVPFAFSRGEALRKARRWVDQNLFSHSVQ